MFKFRRRRKTKYFSKNFPPQVTFYMTWLCLSTYTLQNLRAFSVCVYFTFTRQCVILVVHLVYASGLKSLNWNLYFARNYNHCNFPSINCTSPLFLSLTSFCFIVGLFFTSVRYSSSKGTRSWYLECGIINVRFLNSKWRSWDSVGWITFS